MRSVVRTVLAVTLVVALAAPLAAQEKKRRGGKKRGGQQSRVAAQLMKQLQKEEVKLSDEQKEKIRKIVGEFRPKLAEVQKELGLSPEQRKARTEANAAAKKEGLKGKELQAKSDEAAKLTEAQKKAQLKQRELQAEMRKAIVAVLTPEQVKAAGIRTGGRRKKK